MWDAKTGQLVRVPLPSDDTIYRVAVAEDGERIAAGGKHLYVLDPRIEGSLFGSKLFDDTIWHLDWSPDGKRLAVACWDGSIVALAAPE